MRRALPLLLLLARPVGAHARDLDTQLVQPALTPGAAFSVAGLAPGEPGEAHAGVAVQVERDPLRTWVDGESAGSAVAWRGTLHLAAGLALSSRVDLSARVTGLVQGSEGPSEVAPAHDLALGDLALVGRAALVRRAGWALGPELTLDVPVGTAGSWAAEPNVRLTPAALGQVGAGRWRVLGRLGATLRPEPAVGADLDLRHELVTGLALGWRPYRGLELLAEVDSRHALDSFLRTGGENPAVILAGARGCRPGLACMDLAVGTALSAGYGAASFRALLGISPAPPRPARPAPLRSVQVPLRAEVTTAPTPSAVPGVVERRAWVDHGRIVVRDPILFEVGTARILPESLPVLWAVGEVANDYPEIEHLVVEGHASEEGGVATNYALSLERARTVFEALVEAGVRPERVSYRGLGEVYPDQAENLAAERKVDFLIAGLGPSRADDGGPLLLPWSGEARAAPVLGAARLGSDAHPVLAEVPEAAPPEASPPPSFFEEEPLEEDP